MPRLARTLALFMFLLLLFSGSVNSVSADAADFASFLNKNSVQKNVEKTVQSGIDSEQNGTSSLNNYAYDSTTSIETTWFIKILGPLSNSSGTESGYTEEEKRILTEKYGNGVIGDVTNMTAALYNPPASSRTYVADVLENAHIIPEAQAQGLGFSSLDPILETWKIFRNIAYMFFVIAFLVIGFMIMFRQKIGGQTVVTAQQAIPDIIVSLIFVTFSYAIAGFLIDLMYLLMYLMIGLFPIKDGAEILGRNFVQVGYNLILKSDGAFATVSDSVNSFVSHIANGSSSSFLGGFAGITLALIVAIAVLIGILKLFFELLKSYIAIIISIATSPITLMLGAMPGKNNLASWMKGLAGNLMAFPVVLFALILYEMLTSNTNLDTGGFLPPFLIGRGVSDAVLSLVGIGILLVIPELVKEVKKAFGADGGIFGQLSGAAWGQFKEGWNKGGKQVIGATGFLGATAGTTGIGAATGAYMNREKPGGWKKGAKQGAKYGAAVPALVKSGILKDAYRIVREEAAEGVTEATWGRALDEVAKGEGVFANTAESIRRRTTKQTINEQQEKGKKQTKKGKIGDPDVG